MARLRGRLKFRTRRDPSGAHLAVMLAGRPFAADGKAGRREQPVDRSPVRTPGGPKLNVGGGKGHPPVPGWQIVDLRERTADVVVDIAHEELPFEDDSVAAIFCSHTLEHIPRARLSFVLGEFRRVLHREGLLRVAVPDIELAIRAYLERDWSFFAASEVTPADPDVPLGGLLASWFYSTRPNEAHGFGHVHCFDYEYLAHWLRMAGFGRIWRSRYRGSALEELRGEQFDRHPEDSLFVEATK